MTTFKIKYKKYVADLYMPEKKSSKIVILLPGLPKSANVEKIVKIFLSSGCIVIYPNFSGTFDSDGVFDWEENIKDIKSFVKWSKMKKVSELYFNKNINLGYNNKIILSGMSFGANIALLGCDNNIDKLILLSPVLLFNQFDISKITDFNFKAQMDALLSLLKKAYLFTYRVNNFSKLSRFLYGNNKIQSQENIEKCLIHLKIPTLIIHGKKDTSFPWVITKKLKDSIKNKNITWKFPNIGHSTSSYNINTLNLISQFINKKEENI